MMKLLFEESFKQDELILDFKWIQTGYQEFNQIDIQKICDYVKEIKFKNPTFLYFYTEIVNKDAIDDSVRTMITLKYDLEKFELNTNFSDSLLAMHWDQICDMKSQILGTLN